MTASRPATPATTLQQLTFRLSYADCDPAGIVYFASYLPWMERVNTEWHLREGLDQGEASAPDGIREITRYSGCDYLVPATLYDRLEVSMECDRLGTTSYTLRFPFERESDGAVVAVGTMVLVCLGPEGRPAQVPDRLRGALQRPASHVDGHSSP